MNAVKMVMEEGGCIEFTNGDESQRVSVKPLFEDEESDNYDLKGITILLDDLEDGNSIKANIFFDATGAEIIVKDWDGNSTTTTVYARELYKFASLIIKGIEHKMEMEDLNGQIA